MANEMNKAMETANPQSVLDNESKVSASSVSSENQPPSKRKNKLPWIILAALILIGGIFFGVPAMKEYQLTKDPLNHILHAWVQSVQEHRYDTTLILKGKLDSQALDIEENFKDICSNPQSFVEYVNSLTEHFQLRVDSRSLTDEKDIFLTDFDARLQYRDKNFIQLNGSFKPWDILFHAPDLYSQTLHLPIADILKQENQIDIQAVDIPGYIKILSEKDALTEKVEENAQPYYELLQNLLKAKVEKLPNAVIPLYKDEKIENINVYQYKLHIQTSELYEIYAQILEKTKTDKHLQNLLLDRTGKIIDKALKDKDYEHFGWSKKKFEAEAKDFQNKLSNQYAQQVDQLIQDLRQAAKQLQKKDERLNLDIAYDAILSIDKQHHLRQYELRYAIAPFFHLTQTLTYNAFGAEVNPQAIELSENSVDLYKLQNQSEPPKEMIREVGTNLTSKVLSGEAMEALLKDAQDNKDLLPEKDRDTIANGIQAFVDELKGRIDYLLLMDLL